MRRLILVRHAKSDRSDWGVPDVDRPLAPRGERDAPEMARRLLERQDRLGILCSSTARRAQDTAGHFAAAFGVDSADIHVLAGLYTFSPEELLQELRALDSDADCVTVFGHNPAISAMAAHLTGAVLGDLPTCAVVRMDTDCRSWLGLGNGACVLREVDTPKYPA